MTGDRPAAADRRGTVRPDADWLDALLVAGLSNDALAIADDGFSEHVLLRIDRLQPARAVVSTVPIAPAKAAALYRTWRRAAMRRRRWTCGGSMAGAVLTGGVLTLAGGAPIGLAWWPVAMVASILLTAWVLAQDTET